MKKLITALMVMALLILSAAAVYATEPEEGELEPQTECAHVFDAEVTENQYLQTPGDCATKPVYYVSCSLCGEAGEETFEADFYGDHVYDNGCDPDCNVCGETQDVEHVPGDWAKDESGHWHECAECGARVDEDAHAAGVDDPTTCGVCGYELGPDHTHDFTAQVTDEAYVHTPATCQKEGVYYYSCSICGEKGEETFTVEKAEHVFDRRETEQKYIHTYGNCSTKAVYYYSCVCGKKGTDTFEVAKYGDHVYDSPCDPDCNVCGRIQRITHTPDDIWSSDDNGHWHLCVDCGAKIEEGAHTPGPAATPTNPQICTTCRKVLDVGQDHTHQFGDEWISDGESHWHECACGKEADLGAHSWDDGVVFQEPTTDAPGMKKQTCTVCGATREQSIPKLEPVVNPTGETDAGNEADGDGLNVLAIVLGVLLILSLSTNGILTYLLLDKRKRR